MNEGSKQNKNAKVIAKIDEVLHKLSAFIDGENDL